MEDKNPRFRLSLKKDKKLQLRGYELLSEGFKINCLVKLLKRITFYIKIWFLMSRNSLMIIFSHKLLFLMFLSGKILRFAFFTSFLFFLISGSKSLFGYNVYQAIFFFLTFNLIDILSQFFYREVYRFRHFVVSGDLDLILVKPTNALFRVLMGGPDFTDFVTIPLIFMVIWYVARFLNPTLIQVTYYILLIINGLLIATAFHIVALSLGIITLEIDHIIWIYRDLTNLGRLPIDIYREPLKVVLTFFIPVGVMITFPAKALMGLITFKGVVFSLVFGLITLFLSLKFWNYALKKYTSASS